jgi:hypothetical protein
MGWSAAAAVLMTPEQEAALLAATVAGLDAELREAMADLVGLIRDGVPPRDAVTQVMAGFQGAMAETMAVALSGLLAQSVGTADVMAMQVGAVSLSSRLWAEAAETGEVVQGVVFRHTQGWVDARQLALDLFEGYAFREPGTEPLTMNPRNPKLPKYMREALLPDSAVSDGLARAFAQLQVDGLKTGALRAAYAQALAALDNVEDAAGQALLEKRLQVAFFERMRYFASRIARTELHRAYMNAEAVRLMLDDSVEFVQVRRAPPADACICSLMAGRDLYGLGAGIYPKAQAPKPPYHPHCRCVVSPRLDLTGRTAQERDPQGDAYFLNRLNQSVAGRVMGSRAKAESVLRGVTPESIANAGRDPAYYIGTVGGV